MTPEPLLAAPAAFSSEGSAARLVSQPGLRFAPSRGAAAETIRTSSRDPRAKNVRHIAAWGRTVMPRDPRAHGPLLRAKRSRQRSSRLLFDGSWKWLVRRAGGR